MLLQQRACRSMLTSILAARTESASTGRPGWRPSVYRSIDAVVHSDVPVCLLWAVSCMCVAVFDGSPSRGNGKSLPVCSAQLESMNEVDGTGTATWLAARLCTHGCSPCVSTTRPRYPVAAAARRYSPSSRRCRESPATCPPWTDGWTRRPEPQHTLPKYVDTSN